MKHRFNFLNQSELSALQDSAHLLPGLKQVDLLYFDRKEDAVMLKRIKAQDNMELQSIKISSAERQQCYQFRNRSRNTEWYDPAELPWALEKKTFSTAEIFDEILKSVLCVSFPSTVDQYWNVFVFYFRSNASDFGPVSKDRVLETNQKIIIERLLYSSLKSILESYKRNENALVEYNDNIEQLLMVQGYKLQEKVESIKTLEKVIDTVLISLIDEIKEDGDVVRIAEDAKKLLRLHLGDMGFVKNVLQYALNFAKTLAFGRVDKEIVLEEDYFDSLKEKIVVKTEVKTPQADAYSVHTKTYRFLDDLEQAAKNLSARGMKPTSSNVGSMLANPITAAAISDKLKNHSHKINLLLSQYPDNWSMIRYQFKPLVNIQERFRETRVA